MKGLDDRRGLVSAASHRVDGNPRIIPPEF